MGPENGLIIELRKALRTVNSGNLLLVGGSVRDLLLGLPLGDYDFLWDGDLDALREILSEKLSYSSVRVNSKLLTVSYDTPWGRLDISRARHEEYPSPGVLPQISTVSWREDLSRRDFTINALALPLTLDGWGELVDNFAGLRDLQQKCLRILHPLSFRDDPTRILRGIRLKNRLGLSWEQETRRILEQSWSYLSLVSPARRFKEWQLICREESPADILVEILNLGGWEFFFAGLPYKPEIVQNLASNLALETTIGTTNLAHEIAVDESMIFHKWFFYLLLLLELSPGSTVELAEYWGLPPKVQEQLLLALSLAAKAKGGQDLLDRVFIRQLQQLTLEALYFVFQSSREKSQLSWKEFQQKVKDTKPPIKGRDLLQLNFPPGKEMGDILQQLEEGYWQGKYSTKAEGLSLARKLYRRTDNV